MAHNGPFILCVVLSLIILKGKNLKTSSIVSMLSLILHNLVSSVSYYGSEFNIGYFNSSNGQIKLAVISDRPNTNLTIATLSNYSYTSKINDNSFTFIDLDSNFEVSGSSYSYRELGIDITSSFPISVIGYMTDNSMLPTGSFLSYPYFKQPVNQYIYYGISSNTSCSQILLVGFRDNTSITLIPSINVSLPINSQLGNSTLGVVPRGAKYVTTLHSLQSLLIQSVTTGDDLTGTVITSDSPLTVIGGDACDHASTQVPPTITWGTHFLLAPLHDSKSQQFKVVASEANTSIVYTCGINETSTVLLPSSGVFTFSTNSSQYCDLTCTNRCYVAELRNDTNSILMTVPPTSQFPNNVTFTPLAINTPSYYSVIVPADEYFNGTLIVNGRLREFDWSPIYNVTGSVTGYGYSTNFSGLTTIAHTHTTGRIYVSTYSYSNGGYGYLTGAMFSPNIPQVEFSSEEYCLFEDLNRVDIVLERYNDLSVNFVIDLKIDYDLSGKYQILLTNCIVYLNLKSFRMLPQ